MMMAMSQSNKIESAGVQNHRLVNFYCCAFRLGRCAERTRKYILVRTEYPYVQWWAARVTCTLVCSRGCKRSREGWVPRSLAIVKWSWSTFRWLKIRPPSGVPRPQGPSPLARCHTFPFIGQGKAGRTWEEGKEEREKIERALLGAALSSHL
jgi:hypothetical protein